MNEPVEKSVDYVNNLPETPLAPLTWRDAAAPLLALALALLYRTVFGLEHLGHYGPGIGVPLFVAAYFGAVFLMLGRRAKRTPGAILLLTVSIALSFFCAGSGLPGLVILNCFIILCTAAGATFQLSGHSRVTMEHAAILPETVYLSCQALFTRIGHPFQLLGRLGKERWGKVGRVLLAFGITLPLLAIVLFLLASADAVFESLFDQLGDWLRELSPGKSIWKTLRTLVLTLLIASGLYFITEPPAPEREPPVPKKCPAALYLLIPTILLDVVYLLFCAIQIKYLFGGAEAAAMAGSWAEYAREGFFQLVAVALINLSVCLLGSHKDTLARKGGQVLRVANAILLLLTLIILASAFRRMQLYILAYDLSVLRLMTLWGMLAILAGLLAAGWKLLRPDFLFFRVFVPFVLVSWCLFCLAGPGRIVANYNIACYREAPYTETLDHSYLIRLGPAALPALYELRDSRDAPGQATPTINAICRDMENADHWANWKLTYLLRED